MTDEVKPLSDDEVNKLLVLSQQNTGPSFGYTHELCKAVDALCATVCLLRKANKALAKDVVTATGQAHDYRDKYEQLQSQLAQVTQERERLQMFVAKAAGDGCLRGRSIHCVENEPSSADWCLTCKAKYLVQGDDQT